MPGRVWYEAPSQNCFGIASYIKPTPKLPVTPDALMSERPSSATLLSPAAVRARIVFTCEKMKLPARPTESPVLGILYAAAAEKKRLRSSPWIENHRCTPSTGPAYGLFRNASFLSHD